MFKRSMRERMERVQKILAEIHVILQKLEGRPEREIGKWPKRNGPLGRLIDEVSAFREEVSFLMRDVRAGRAVPRARRELLESFQRLRRMVRLYGGTATSSPGATRGRIGLRALNKPLRKLYSAVRDLKESDTKFQGQLKKMLEKTGLTVYGLAAKSDVDPAYVRRLINGERRNPSRDVVATLGETLLGVSNEVTEQDVGRLLEAAGYSVQNGRRH